MPVKFENSVFINCPFDEAFEPLLQSMLFCVKFLGFYPRLATETADGAENQLDKICQIIHQSKYSIHDLSRTQAVKKGEFYRLNMPLELGIDYGCRKYGGAAFLAKKFLVLEEKRYVSKAALSDMAGCDFEAHGGRFDTVVEKVRNWLVSEAGAEHIGSTKILGRYTDFQEWYFESKLATGASEAEIKRYPTSELMAGMSTWLELQM